MSPPSGPVGTGGQEMSDNKLYLIGQYDCEPLSAKSPQCGGPQKIGRASCRERV